MILHSERKAVYDNNHDSESQRSNSHIQWYEYERSLWVGLSSVQIMELGLMRTIFVMVLGMKLLELLDVIELGICLYKKYVTILTDSINIMHF